MTEATKQLASDVATLIERRRRRRKLALYGGLAGAIVLAVLYGTCGHGWGLGSGSGTGSGTGSNVATADAGPPRCMVRVTATGYRVGDKPATRDAVVAMCRKTAGADIVILGDSREGDWDELRAALSAAHVRIYLRD